MIKTDFRLEIDESQLLQYMGSQAAKSSFERILNSPSKKRDFKKAQADLLRLAEPKGCWRRYPLKKIEGEQLVLENNVTFGGGPVAQVIEGADIIIVGVCTIGRKVEEAVAEYLHHHQLTRGFLLDQCANWAVDVLRNKFYNYIRNLEKSQHNPHVSIMLWPGQDWLLDDQAVLFHLLGDEPKRIQVQLTPSLLMVPRKTVSFLLGVGKTSLGMEEGIQCQICSINKACPGYKIRMRWVSSHEP